MFTKLKKLLTPKKDRRPAFVKNAWKRWKKLRRRYKFLLIIVVLILLGFWAFKSFSARNKKNAIEIATVSRQDIERKILRSGSIEYKGITPIFSASDGEVTDLFVENGDTVKKDTPLFRVKSTASQEERAQAWSAYLGAKNALEAARQGTNQSLSSLESARQKLLTAEQAVKNAEDHRGDYTDNEFQALQSARRVAELNLQLAESDTTTVDDRIRAAQADLQVAWLKYQATRDLTVLATANGQIENLSITTGDTVSHTDTTPTLLIVSDPRQIIPVSVGEIDAALLQASQSAEMSVDAFPDRVFPAYVSRVDRVGMKDESGNVNYTAWLEIDQVEPNLLAGMAADVEILIDTRENVLAVPNEALQYRAGSYFLQLGNEEKIVQDTVEVETGLRNEAFTEILSGVEENQQVLILPR